MTPPPFDNPLIVAILIGCVFLAFYFVAYLPAIIETVVEKVRARFAGRGA